MFWWLLYSFYVAVTRPLKVTTHLVEKLVVFIYTIVVDTITVSWPKKQNKWDEKKINYFMELWANTTEKGEKGLAIIRGK